MNSWKLPSILIPLLLLSTAANAIEDKQKKFSEPEDLKQRFLAQQGDGAGDSMPHGAGSAWADSFSNAKNNQQSNEMQSRNSEQNSEYSSGPPQPYSAPAGGYSGSYPSNSGNFNTGNREIGNSGYGNSHMNDSGMGNSEYSNSQMNNARVVNSRFGNSAYHQANYYPWQDHMSQGIVRSQMQPALLPEGLVLPIQLDSSIDIDKAAAGDYVQAHVTQNFSAGGAAYLPGGTVISGTVTEVSEEKNLGHGGKLSIDFVQVRLPSGQLIRMNAHLLGRIASYVPRDPTSAGSKFASAAWHGGLGSGLSAGTGTVFSAIADGGSGPGGGAYAGAFLGSASGLLETLFYRHGHRQDTFLHPGTRMQMQLDSNLDLPSAAEEHQLRYQ